MPYTPPAQQQSPASSKTTSPNLSRASSYSIDSPGVRSPTSPRPSLPRSVSSATYLNKQRRGPSAIQAETLTFPQSPLEDSPSGATHVSRTDDTLSRNGSIRPSPPPVNNLLIPTGAILSPPDSSENSDGDDTSDRSPRGRELGRTWGELEQAVRSIELKREPSPSRDGSNTVSFSEPTTTIHSPTALSAEARKISHSRSSTETAIMVPAERPNYSETPTSDDSDDDTELRIKPPLVRKKSGELVKPALRPSSRRRYSSMPGTPTYGKSVHFNDNGNQTRHFLQVDKPSAVSAGSSPAETYESETEYPFEKRDVSKVEWDIKLANFPEETYERQSRPVRVERFFLSADTKTLIGIVAVANIAFQKNVVARFTLDYWKTTSEISAEYDNDVRRQNPSDGCDRFSFSIQLSDQANLENKTLLLCVRYNAGGQEHWDSNDSMNYQIDFTKKLAKSASTSSLALPSSNRAARHSIPRSRHSPPVRAPPSDDESGMDSGAAYHFGSPEKIMGDSSHSQVKLKPRSKRVDLFRAGSAPSANGLGGRYDFGASLSAALSSAQDKLGKQSGLMPHQLHNAPRPGANYFSRVAPAETKSTTAEESPDSLTTDRPAMGSEQYKDLVQKFCYFTPGGSGKLSPPNTAQPTKPAGTDGAWESATPSEYSSRTGSTTPSPPQSMSPLLDGSNDRRAFSAITSRSGSPAPTSNNGYGGMSPTMSYGYPFRQNGYLSESPAPTAIRG